MICTEVGELMQRQLDHDLDEQELTQLMTHLSECKACQELFERLTLLSGSLEQLPRVTPSISIVDSIMPELEAIDRQRTKQAERTVKSALWRRWMTAAASVAAAAAVILLMTNLDNSSKSNNTASDTVAMLQESSRIAADNEINSGDSTSSTFVSTMVEELSGDAEDELGYHITPLSSPIQSMKVENNSHTESNDSSSTKEARELNPQPTTEPPTSTSQGEEQEKMYIAHVHDQSQNSGQINGDGPHSEEMINSQSVIEEEQNMLGVNKDNVDEQLNSSLGITSINPIEEKHFSPDGQVYIVIEGHTIMLYETSSEAKLQTWEADPKGIIFFAEWDEFGQEFSYEQLDDEGQNTRHTITIKN